MATSIKEGLNYIIQAIQNMIEPQLDKLRYDRTYRAKVIEKIEAGLYKVQINGTEYKVNYSGNLNVGDIVKVKAPLNNFSDIYIETLPSSGGSGGTSNYNDLVNKPILNTNNTAGQDINNAETIRGTINLHKISKTGNYTDLRNLPSLDFIPNSQKGAANGVATLNEEKIVVKDNLPSDIVFDSNYVHTDNNFTTALKNKLNGIATGAQVNKIETIQRNGTALAITNKTVNITVPTKTSDLTNDSNFVVDSNYVHTDNNFTTTLETKLNGIASGAQVNVIEKIQKNGTDLSIVNKTVNITVPTKTSELINDGEDGTNKFLTQVPIASKTTLGGIKIGNNLIITEDGTLSAIGGIGITVVDNLTSTSAIDALSANQGRVLNDKIAALDTNIEDIQQDIINIEDNMITTIQKNGTTLPISNKTVNITVPTKTSELTNNSNFVADSSYVHTDNNFTTALKNKLNGIASGATKVVVEDNLTSSSATNALSANQGRNLNTNKVTRIQVSDSDIDNISETEFRYTSNSAKTPNNANGYLFTHVLEDNYILQEFTAYSGMRKWVRAKTEGNWNDWGMIWRKQTVLYDNTSGTTGTITIPVHASNFAYIEIFFGKNNSYSSSIVLNPDGKKCNLTLFERSSDENVQQLISADVLINNYSISKRYVGNINFGIDGSLIGGTGTDNSILIYRVVGYR